MSIREIAERHDVGAVLVGALPLPDELSLRADIRDERLRCVLDAIAIVHERTHAWPVDLRLVAEALLELGTFEDIGGFAFLHELIEGYDERDERAQRHAAVEIWARETLRRVRLQDRAESAAIAAVGRYRAAKGSADELLAIGPGGDS